MSTYSQPVHDALKREIRDARARDPLISSAELVEHLSKRFNRSFDHRYVKKLSEKVARQALVDADRTQIEERLSFTRENYRMMREELLKIVYWREDNTNGMSRPRAQDRIEAAKNIVGMDLALLNAELANGMYRKPITEVAKTFQYEPLPGEVRTVIISSWMRGGLLPQAAIEQMVPALPQHAATDTATA
jgi:hypothetical protein